jgi:hypothetical protein
MRPAIAEHLRPRRPRITTRRVVGTLIAIPLAYLVLIVAAAHLGFGTLQ